MKIIMCCKIKSSQIVTLFKVSNIVFFQSESSRHLSALVMYIMHERICKVYINDYQKWRKIWCTHLLYKCNYLPIMVLAASQQNQRILGVFPSNIQSYLPESPFVQQAGTFALHSLPYHLSFSLHCTHVAVILWCCNW